MATVEVVGKAQIITISKREAISLIAKLACQLEPVYHGDLYPDRLFPNVQLLIEDHGRGEKIMFCVDINKDKVDGS